MGEGYKGCKIIIKNVVFKIFSPILLSFVVTPKGGRRERE